MKRLSTLLSALILSASPVVAQDIIVLECPLTAYASLTNPQTSNVVGSHKEDKREIFTIDLKNKTLSGEGDAPMSIEIYDGQIMAKDRSDGVEFNMSINLNPPRNLIGISKSISVRDGKKYELDILIKGICKRTNR